PENTGENEHGGDCQTDSNLDPPKLSPNIRAEFETEAGVKNWPKKLRHRGRVLARIYRQASRHGYRVYWRVREDGQAKSRQKEFIAYSEAKRFGDRLVSDLAKGSQVTALTPGQASDALHAMQTLQAHYQATGRRLTLAGMAEGF